MELNNLVKDIDYKSLIIGTLLFTVTVLLSLTYEQLYFLSYLTFIGLLYIGYKAKDYLKGIFLSIIATLPTYIIILYLNPQEIVKNLDIGLMTLIGLIIVGVLGGFLGVYLYKYQKKK